MSTPRRQAVGWLTRWAAGLRFPTLLAVTAALFLLDLFVPDFVPFADELILGLFTVVLATLRKRKSGRDATVSGEPVRDRNESPPPRR